MPLCFLWMKIASDNFRLINTQTQEEYWAFVRDKICEHWLRYPLEGEVSDRKLECESNLLILLRKLREGLLAAKREDEFALNVYECSLCLGVIFRSPIHATSPVSRLPSLYLSQKQRDIPSPNDLSSEAISERALTTSVISLLHHLNENYPSQVSYFSHLESLPTSCFDQKSHLFVWLLSLRSAMQSRNYVKFESLTQTHFLSSMFKDIRGFAVADTLQIAFNIHEEAIRVLIDMLRAKMREDAWKTLRTAYREVSFASDSRDWLSRTVMLQSVSRSHRNKRTDVDLTDWINNKVKDGYLRAKEGSENRWTICRTNSK
ncbi:hypothetical protein BD410DRAFT_420097 [Rickenella mellea]|uniref:PCI domain-containing protein n=1 Tax=Rickenella mellea TaxID=50990 RepID=A0A4Y7QKT0_9AGAM|nr:hypothetical protein BD410DRAFT_420097 [Rickenella mellea]